MLKLQDIPKQFWEDLKWGRKHRSELLMQYPDQWIAIDNKKVISAGKSLSAVEEEAKKKTKKKQIPLLFIDCGDHIYGI
ncbi:MAG: DUF5678 domain-containing protein [Methanosarcinales archaeon]